MRTLWLALTFGFFADASSASAQPIVSVRAETRLEAATEVLSPGVLARGTLRDDAGAPLPSRTISVTLRGGDGSDHIQLQTDTAGEFETQVPLDTTSVELRFDAEEFLMSSAAVLRIDADRAHVTLLVETPGTAGQFSLDESEHVLAISAESEHGGDGLRITLTNELGQLLGAGTTDSAAQWTVHLRSSELGTAGVGRLIVRSAADGRRAAAQTEVPIVRSRTTHTELASASVVEGGLRVRGSLNTAEHPLERRAVSVLVNGVLAATALTDLNGQIDVTVAPEGLPSDSYSVALRFDSDAPWLLSSNSNVATVQQSIRRWILPALAFLSALVVLLISRWPRIRSADSALADASLAEAGVTLQKVKQRASVMKIEAFVVRAGTGTPLPSVRVGLPETELATTDDLGLFSASLGSGTHTLTFEADGYEPLTHRVAVPHRGEWSGATVRLRNRRDLANEVMLEAFAPRIPREDWGAATNRELFAKARERGVGSLELLALVDAVEALVYASHPPSSDNLAHIRELARLTHPLAR